MDIEIKQINVSLIRSLELLAVEAQFEGFNFVRRTIDEWKSGMNCFSKKGEILFGIFTSNLCIGIGGLNIDPYIDDPSIGRIRHLYISQEHPRKGLATLLLKKIIKTAATYFETVRLFTNNPEASLFYESMGFDHSNSIKETHILKDLKKIL
jgi:GNAT superfamily N-acetyltransferase